MTDEEVLAWATTQRLVGNLYTGAERALAEAQGCDVREASLLLRFEQPYAATFDNDVRETHTWATIDTDEELRLLAAGRVAEWLVVPIQAADSRRLVASLAGTGLRESREWRPAGMYLRPFVVAKVEHE